MSEQQEELSEVVGSNAETVEAAADGSQLAASDSQQDEPKAQARPNSGSSVATKIAAFASGVAYVKGGIKDASEDAILVEDVLHKFEAASRRPGDGELQLPLPLIRAAYEHLLSARQEASRAAKELAELKASRVQHIPPSTWVKREAKYKMDQEKYEHTISMLNQRIERLESELHVLQEGANLRPLEEKIKDLESQLVAASEEKTKVQSKYHELSIKHRQLIETSPQVATIWNEVLVQQAQAHGDAAAEQRLRNFDLRHTGASSGLSITGNQVRSPAAVTASGEVSPRKLMGVSAATAIFSGNGIPQVPVSAAGIRADGKTVSAATQHLLEAASIDAGPQTPVLFDSTASPSSSAPSSRAVSSGAAGPAAADGAAAGSVGAAAVLAAVPGLQTAEERAQALMQAVALEGLSPEASLAALQQLNYDLTMQLALYQQMVGRLKDAMEQSDLEKAELEAEKVAIEQQLAAALNGHMDGLATAHSMGAASGNSKRGWGLGGFWRRGGANATTEEGEVEGSFADTNSITGLASLSSSRTASMDLEAVVAGNSGSPRSAADTPTLRDSTSSSQSAAESAESQQQQQTGGEAGSAGAGGPTTSATASAATRSTSIGRVFAQRRASAAARAATAAENMQKELKEVRRQLTSVQDENKFLVQNLVEIKMELAETQSSHDQAKRALVRAMDREVCLDTKVSELAYMLDMLTSQQDRGSVPVTGPTIVKSTSNASATAVVAAEQVDEQQQSIQLDGDDAEMQQQDAADASVAATEPIEHKAGSLVADRTNGVQDAHKAPAEIEGDADMLDNSAAGSPAANVGQRAPAVNAAVDSSIVEAHSISNAGSDYEDVDSKSSSKSEFLQQEQQDLKAAG